MMERTHLKTFLYWKHNLPPDAHACIAAALRQDPGIWQILQDEAFAIRAVNRPCSAPMDWSPAALALMLLDHPVQAAELQNNPGITLDHKALQTAIKAFETYHPQPEMSAIENLKTAGLVALLLRERRRKTGSWQGLVSELLKNRAATLQDWVSPLACTFGMIADQQNFLAALLETPTQEAAVPVLVQVVLRNPLSLNDQVALLHGVLSKKLVHPGQIFELVGQQRPSLAQALAQRLITDHHEDIFNSLPGAYFSYESILHSIRRLTWQALLQHNLGNTLESMDLLKQAGREGVLLASELSAQWAGLAQSQPQDVTPGEIHQAWQAAASTELPEWLRRFPDEQLSANPSYTQALRTAAYRAEKPSDGYNQADNQSQDASLLLAMAYASLENKEIVSAMNLAQTALAHFTLIETQENTWPGASQETLDNLTRLAELFLTLGMAGSAASAALKVLGASPASVPALLAAGAAFSRQQRIAQAVEYHLTAALLAPDHMDAQRGSAVALESAEAYDLALLGWMQIVQRGQIENNVKAADLHSLAACALRAGVYQQAAEACETALQLNAEDWKAHHLYGLVFSQIGDSEQSMLHLQKAVELDCQQVESWLALAELLAEHGGPAKADETLLAALQAVPNSPQLHLAYGENLLRQNAQTQALEAFRSAYELVNSQPGSDENLINRAGMLYAGMLLQLGHLSEAQAVIAPIYHSSPQNPDSAKIYAQTLASQKDFAAALPALQTAVGSKNELGSCSDANLLRSYGEALLVLNLDPAQAVNALKRSLELSSDELETQTLLAEAYTAVCDYPHALEMYRAANDSPQVKPPYLQIRLAKGMGKTALALELAPVALAAFQDVISLDSASSENYRLLAEANWMAGLGNHAWAAARNVIHLDSQPETAVWFADKALEWSVFGGAVHPNGGEGAQLTGLISAAKIKKTSNRTLTISAQEMLSEAVLVLRQTHEDHPDSAALLIRLGLTLARLDNRPEAAAILAQTALMAEATPVELDQAAAELLRLYEVANQNGEPSALQTAENAAACFEKAAERALQASAEEQAMRLLKLASARRCARQPVEMLQTLDAALLLAPQLPQIYQEMFAACVAENNMERALCIVEQANCMIEDAGVLTTLHLQASKLCQSAGRLALALFHAGKAQTHALTRPGNPADGIEAAASLQMARLYHLALLTTQARNALSDTPLQSLLDDQDALEFCCLQSEMSLDAGQEIEAAFYLNQAFKCSPTYPWAAALQARLMHKQKDQPLAVNTLKEIARSLAAEESGDVQACLSVARAAGEMAEWDLALEMARRAAQPAPGAQVSAPRHTLFVAELLVRQAEFARLCQELDVQMHTPGSIALDEQSQAQYLQAVQTAESALLQAMQDSAALGTDDAQSWAEASQQVARWKCRGAAVFNQAGQRTAAVPLAWAVWTGFTLEADDCAMQMAFIRQNKTQAYRLSAAAQAREAAEAFSTESKVYLQAALTLAASAPNEALRYAQTAASLLSSLPRHPLNILAHRLLAQLEKQNGYFLPALQSIHVALAAWPNEARWHNLAARIRLALPEILPAEVGLNNTPDAVAYLEEAICLEPGYADHAILLSKILQDNTNDDPQSLRKSLKILEKASSDNPDSPTIWLALANLYRNTANKAATAGKTERKLALSSVISAAACAERAASLAGEQNDPETGANAYVLLGQLALAKGDAEEGYRQARAALRLQNASTPAVLLQVECLEAMGRPEDAIDLLNKSLALGPNNLNIEIKRAALMSAKTEQQPSEKADLAKSPTLVGLKMLETLAQQYPDQPKVHFALAKSQAAANHKEEAIQSAQAALTLTQKAEAAAQPVETDGSPETLDALSANEISEMHTLLGGLFADMGHLDQSVHQFDTALQYNPGNGDAYLALSKVYLKQRLFMKAQDVLREAMSAAPHDPRVYYHAGIVYKQGHNLKEAETALQKAASLAPDDIQIKRQLASIVAARLMQSRQGIAQLAENMDGVS